MRKKSMRKLAVLVATGFGLGYSPVASGTVGTLLGVVFVVVRGDQCAIPLQILSAVLLAGAAIPICGAAEKVFGNKDDGRIVADEFLTFPICVIGLPWQAHPWLLAVAFVAHRVFDIVKPTPARQSQALRGGLGIVADDVIASIYALLFTHLLFRLVAG